MTLSYAQAISWLSQNPNASVAELRNLVSQISVDVAGAKTTLLYSGSISNIETWKIAEAIGKNNVGIATIGKTDVFEFLNDTTFQGAIRAATNREGLDFDLILEGKSPNGTRISNSSMWDIASENFAKNAVGEVKTIAPTAEGGAVFSSTEIPALLDNPKVTSIDGIPVAELKATYNSEGIGAVLTKVKQASGGNFALLEIATDPSDGKLITAIGDEKFFENIPEVTGTALPENVGNIKNGTTILNQDSGWKGFIGGLTDTNFLSKSTLAKLGVAGDILSLTFAASSAEAAAENGDHAKAASIMETWTADFLGGAAGGVAAALAIAPLIAALSVGGIVGGALAISAGIVGGVYGGDAGVYLLNKAKELGIVSDQDVVDFTKALQDYLNSLNEDAKTVGNYIADLLKSLTQGEATPFNNPRYDPLTLDLDGDGVELISLNKSTAFFDLDNDALREKVGWVKADDGILVLDSNNNNSVDNITELFGYRGENGVQVTGTEELRTHDLNNDGKINSSDAIFSKLKIWQDTNQNGISEVNELKTLSDYGITSINVAQSGVTDLNQLQEGNLIISKSTYTKTVTNNDGTTTEVTRDYANLDLAIDQTNSSSYAYQDESGNNVTYDLNLDVLNLPMSRGYGNLKAWHIAMSEDEDLLNIMKEIVSVAQESSELSYKDLDQQIESFIYQWSHVQDISLLSMRGSFSAQKLAAMEAIQEMKPRVENYSSLKNLGLVAIENSIN